ncbi:MAG TPA: DUF2911 domain-containing protein [Chitinophagaceae bacterium]|nr:DUF2911 domain-containing protein [Chitinophagaceae bacterium]
MVKEFFKRTALALVLLCSLSAAAVAQSKFASLDKSPMDVSYYPVNYPVLKIQDRASEPVVARVIYSRPQKNGRVVFGELVEYGKVWRLGANEATEIELFKDVKVGGKKLKKGRYTMYALVNPDKWSIIFNSDLDTWGAFKYDQKKDVLRVDVPVQKNTEVLEALTVAFEKTNGTTFNLVAGWDDLVVRLPMSL